MVSISSNNIILKEAQQKLLQLSPEKLQIALEILTDLQEKDAQEATLELLNIPDFEAEFKEAVQQADLGEIVSFDSIRRHV